MAKLKKNVGKANKSSEAKAAKPAAKSKKASKSMFANAKPKKTVSISSRDKKLLIVLGAVIIFLCTYFFGFSNKLTEIQDIEAESESLKVRIADLTQRAAQAEGLKEETASIREGMKEKLDEFPSEVNTEDIIYFLNQMEEKEENEFQIMNESFGSMDAFYNTAEAAAQQAPAAETAEGQDVVADAAGTISYRAPQYATANTTDEQENASEEAETAQEPAEGETQDAMEQLEAAEQKMLEEGASEETEGGLNTEGPYTGYQVTVNISYSTTYKGIKNVIDMINKHKDKVRIQSVSASFDNTSGTLTGSMTLNFYAIGGNGKPYKAPSIKGIPIGTDNIFGTVSKEAE